MNKIYFDITGWVDLTGCSSTQAQIAANEYLEDRAPKAAHFAASWGVDSTLHISDFLLAEDKSGRFIFLGDKDDE